MDRTTLELVGMGDTIAELGRYFGKVFQGGREAMESGGKYVFLWKRTLYGWKIHWEVELEDILEDRLG